MYKKKLIDDVKAIILQKGLFKMVMRFKRPAVLWLREEMGGGEGDKISLVT